MTSVTTLHHSPWSPQPYDVDAFLAELLPVLRRHFRGNCLNLMPGLVQLPGSLKGTPFTPTPNANTFPRMPTPTTCDAVPMPVMPVMPIPAPIPVRAIPATPTPVTPAPVMLPNEVDYVIGDANTCDANTCDAS